MTEVTLDITRTTDGAIRLTLRPAKSNGISLLVNSAIPINKKYGLGEDAKIHLFSEDAFVLDINKDYFEER